MPTAESAVTPAVAVSASSETPKHDHLSPHGVLGVFMATSADRSTAKLCSDGPFIRMLVDSGASDRYVPPSLTPGLRASIGDFDVLQVPHTIVAAGQGLLKGVAMGTVHGTVTDDGGNKRHNSFRAVVVPVLGTNLFSVTTAMLKGVTTLFHPANPRLEKAGVVLPMQQLGTDETTGKQLCTIDVNLGDGVGGGMELGDNSDCLVLKIESADMWHQRMGHINRKSLDVLRKLPGNGVDYNEEMQA